MLLRPGNKVVIKDQYAGEHEVDDGLFILNKEQVYVVESVMAMGYYGDMVKIFGMSIWWWDYFWVKKPFGFVLGELE